METLTREEFDELVAKADAGTATPEDLARLEPYRAKRAVLLASGMGTRMAPITINTPKPLVRVNGRRIISSLLDALAAIGVDDITIVVGYLAEEFDVLLRDYPQVKLVKNDQYATTNNISSAVLASGCFENAYVFESDLLLQSPALLTKYQYESNYLGVFVDETPDWCFDTDDAGVIRDLHKGGTHCAHMFGISYWTAEDGRKLAHDLPKQFAKPENRQRFWDDVPCVLCRDRYRVRVRPCMFDDIAEIDSLAELAQIDPAYRM
ncbi:MAG: phosphocholine cytidylyltransferase family protein [Eggerthellaceae bacterium]